MIVSHEHKFIFLKTKKTAGTSIELALSQPCGPHDIITPLTKIDEALHDDVERAATIKARLTPDDILTLPSMLKRCGLTNIRRLGASDAFHKSAQRLLYAAEPSSVTANRQKM